MRIRSIKPEFWRDEEIQNWPALTRLAYIAMWNEADDTGRIRANPGYLRSVLLPYDAGPGADNVFEPIIHAGKLIIYTADGQTWGVLVNFMLHQKIDRPSPSKCPPPDQTTVDRIRTYMEQHHKLQAHEIESFIKKITNHCAITPPRFPAPADDSRKARRGLADDSRRIPTGTGNRDRGKGTGNRDPVSPPVIPHGECGRGARQTSQDEECEDKAFRILKSRPELSKLTVEQYFAAQVYIRGFYPRYDFQGVAETIAGLACLNGKINAPGAWLQKQYERLGPKFGRR